jgi:tripartite-type tricarboxylate transporter receptor subunit TctC
VAHAQDIRGIFTLNFTVKETEMRLIVSGLFLVMGLVTSAMAQPYPARAVRFIIPFPPGGGVDVLTRAVAADLTAKWGQPVIVDNRPGAGGNIGADAVAKSTPDGYTLLATINQTFTSNRFLYKSLPYDPDRAFLPITLMIQSEQFLLAHSAVPAKNLRELVALAKAQPGKLTYGSFGTGSQPLLIYETLNKREGLDLLHVPYKGIAPTLLALTAGEVNLTVASFGVAGELLKAGRIKPLAIAGKRRDPKFPEVATTAELGYPYLQASIWYGMFAPAGTAPSIADKIGNEVRAILRAPAFAEKHIAARGFDLVAGSPQELAAVIRDESAIVGEMIRAAGVQPE